MDTIDVKEQLEKLLHDAFDFHPKFLEEFMGMIENTGAERKLIKQFIAKLQIIIKHNDIDYGLPWLEHLKKYGNMYSLHLTAASKNYRLLFSKTKNGKLFLHAFYEKAGKKTSSYDKHVTIAIERRKEYI